jgi:hypothetical protein
MSGSIFVHDFSRHASADWPVECGAPAESYDEALMRRIAAALGRSLDRTPPAGDDLWTPVIANHQNFVDLLTSGQLSRERSPSGTDLTFGTLLQRQERVGDVIDEIGGFHRFARFPFWMRPGHVEDIYEATDVP